MFTSSFLSSISLCFVSLIFSFLSKRAISFSISLIFLFSLSHSCLDVLRLIIVLAAVVEEEVVVDVVVVR